MLEKRYSNEFKEEAVKQVIECGGQGTPCSPIRTLKQ